MEESNKYIYRAVEPMKISVVITLLNEEGNINALINSLENQSVLPDEILIVDGGSTDQTTSIINERIRRNNSIRLISKKGSIAHGRNTSIREAAHEIIAQTDGGCVMHSKWLERITAPLQDKNIGMVAGFYDMIASTPFQEALAPYHGTIKQKFDPRHFMPSGRSIAFRKEVWEHVGGYSESLERAGEDTLFNYRILIAGVRIKRVPEATVAWEVPKSFTTSLKKFYYYAKGDAQASIWWHPAQRLHTHNIKILSIFARYVIGLSLLLLSPFYPILLVVLITGFILYSFWSIWKMREIVHSFKASLYLPLIQISSDLMVMAGFISGMLSKLSPSKL